MSCALHTTFNGLGYSMNSSGNYSTYAPPCTCADGAASVAGAAAAAAAAMVAGAWDSPPPLTRSMTSYGPGTGAGGGSSAAAAAAGGGPPPLSQTRAPLLARSNGGGISPDDLWAPPGPAIRGPPALSRSMTNAYSYEEERGFSNRTPARESRFSAVSEEDGGAAAPPPVRRTGTEHHGPPVRRTDVEQNLPWIIDDIGLEQQKERTRDSLRQLLYALQTEMERARPAARSHDEMAADDARWNELDEQIEAVLRLLTALN